MIAIVDYGLGNIKAFANVYKRLDIPCCVADTVSDLEQATRIILPGVGAFDHAMSLLNSSGLRETLDDLVLNRRTPVLGICVGMQMLADSSEEGRLPGLGWIPGQVKRFPHDATGKSSDYPLPHMGWNSISIERGDPLLEKLETPPRFYFLHSYYYECSDAENTLAIANYGISFSCVVNRHNIYGVQCHPEKSHHNGVALLGNFARI